jgi:hypothetical protein
MGERSMEGHPSNKAPAWQRRGIFNCKEPLSLSDALAVHFQIADGHPAMGKKRVHVSTMPS